MHLTRPIFPSKLLKSNFWMTSTCVVRQNLKKVAKNYFKNVEKNIRKKICLNNLLKRKHSNSKSVDRNLLTQMDTSWAPIWLVGCRLQNRRHCLKLVFILEDVDTASTTSSQRIKKKNSWLLTKMPSLKALPTHQECNSSKIRKR